MTALKGKSIKAFLSSRDKSISAVLVYGPDNGLVRERASIVAKQVTPDLSDPFNTCDLTDADLKEDPARLGDELAALSFMGGERVISLRTVGEASSKAISNFLERLDGGLIEPNGLVIIEGGDLSPRSGVRKSFEKARRAVALPCYSETAADIRTLAKTRALAEDLRFDDDALDLVVATLGDDHALSLSELEKLLLFKGPKSLRNGPGTISVDDVRASLVDRLGDTMDDTAAACADGAPRALADALHKASVSGASPIGILRALYRQFTRLREAAKFVDAGASPAAAMKNLRPPVFFAEQRAFENRLYKWRGDKLNTAIRMLIETETAAKSTGAPQRELVERTALRLAMMARR